MKQALTEALADESAGRWSWQLPMFVAAACLVERLLPGECEHGRTEPHDYADPSFPQAGWHIIHCNGQVWDEGIVAAVENVVDAWAPDLNDYAKEQFTNELLSVLVEQVEAGSQ